MYLLFLRVQAVCYSYKLVLPMHAGFVKCVLVFTSTYYLVAIYDECYLGPVKVDYYLNRSVIVVKCFCYLCVLVAMSDYTRLELCTFRLRQDL